MTFFQDVANSFKLNFLTGSDPDAQMIRKLKKSQTNLTKLQWVDFFFDFTEEAAAESLSAALQGVGFGSFVYQDEGGTYRCQAKKHMLIDLEKMQAMTVRFDELAVRMGGTYIGWDVQTTKN